jgi:superfamily I DNA/RNA helicase
MVDEYQDTNHAQYKLCKLLASVHRNICVVGDDDQSIYRFRGATIENILNFEMKYPDAVVIKLEQNYRSTGNILDAANAVIGTGVNRHAKKLWSALGEGQKPQMLLFDRDDAEADFTAQLIRARKAERPELKYRDFAVLYRSNQLSRQIEQALMSAGIPYRLVGGQQFFQRREIKDAVAYLKLLTNPKDDQSLLRILAAPPRGIGPKAVQELKRRRAEQHIPMSVTLRNADFQKSLTAKGREELQKMLTAFDAAKADFSVPGNVSGKIIRFLDQVGYSGGLQKIYRDLEDSIKRRDNVDEFISAVAQFEKKHGGETTLDDYLESYSLMEENDRVQEESPDADAVTLTSIHAAKGLEYPVVIQIAMEKNIFPHERALEEGGYEEELRLFYVAITRANRNFT